jgi:hypothetical protein
MKRLHCDGCGLTEAVDQPKHKIEHVSFTLNENTRFPADTVKHEADLCPTCRGQLLHQYFNMPAEGTLELPAFISPVPALKQVS